jgi:hypothetical protein
MNELLEAQLATLNAELAAAVPGSPQAIALQSQISTLEIELSENPVVPHIFPHFFPGPHGPHGR